jgi:hypothetical protein
MAWWQALQSVSEVAGCISATLGRVGCGPRLGSWRVTGSAGHTLTLSRRHHDHACGGPYFNCHETKARTALLQPVDDSHPGDSDDATASL